MSRLRIAHLSDSHFGTIKNGVREGLIETLKELKPDLILLTGDITQRARAQEFKEASDFVNQLKPTPLIAVPGNHDLPVYNIFRRLFSPYYSFKTLFKDQLEKDFVYGDVVVKGLNSTSRWRHIQGDFNLRRLDRRLREKKVQAKVHIAAFHHPMDCAKVQDEKNLLQQKEDAIELFAHHQIDLIIGGHIHDPYVNLSTQRYPNTQRSMIIGVAGTCTSWRTRSGAPNSFNLIDVETQHQFPRIIFSRYDQRADLRFTVENVKAFSRKSDTGWTVD
jgi:3',5'-cyclic AMP phosphodiesterase CpdA